MSFVVEFLVRSWKWIIGIFFFAAYNRKKKKLAQRVNEVKELRALIRIMDKHKKIEEASREKKKKLDHADSPGALSRLWNGVRGKDKKD